MKATIVPKTITPAFRWSLDAGGDWQLYAGPERPDVYWGMICPHHPGEYHIVWDGQHQKIIRGKSLEDAKTIAEKLCARDLLADSFEVKYE